MPFTGPVLEKIVDEAAQWYRDTLLKIMDELEREYPYGAVKLSPAEQLAKYSSMTDQDWEQLFARLERRYRGFPNSADLVERDAARYIKRMETLRAKVSDVIPGFQAGRGTGAGQVPEAGALGAPAGPQFSA